MSLTRVIVADLDESSHQQAVISMLDAYSADPMGDHARLSAYAREHLIDGLREHPTTLIFLAMQADVAVGIAVCFRGFSTFAAKPLINLHDFYVADAIRGQGIATLLLRAIEDQAKRLGCCKLTLEVQTNNSHARAVYERCGFAQAVYPADQHGGGSLFLAKPIG